MSLWSLYYMILENVKDMFVVKYALLLFVWLYLSE